MDDFRRLLLFLVLSMGLLFLWNAVRPPAQKPEQPPAQADPVKQAAAPGEESPRSKTADGNTGPAAAKSPSNKTTKPGTKPGTEPTAQPATTGSPAALPEHPFEVITLGSDDPASGYGLSVQVTTRGAALLVAALNEPRYQSLPRPGIEKDPPLSIVGDHLRGLDSNGDGLTATELDAWKSSPLGMKTLPLTLQTSIAALDKQLAAIDPAASLNALNWKVTDRTSDGSTPQGVSFTLEVDHVLLTKTYRLKRLDDDRVGQITAGSSPTNLFDKDPAAYQLEFSFTLKNQGDSEKSLAYELQGPVGLPLEDLENSRYTSGIKWARRRGKQAEAVGTISAEDIVENVDEQERQETPEETWEYVGVDVQYFAALLTPSRDQVDQHPGATPRGYIKQARPQMVHRDTAAPRYVQVSVSLASHEITLAAGEEVTHGYTLFAGPKRPTLLQVLKAQDVIDVTNIFYIGKYISSGMLYFLGVIHAMVPMLGYGFAIIVLTVSCRLMMHPLTRKQALSAKIMKELKPEIEKLKEKHGNDKQAFGRAQMELFRKNNYNPFSGCLPIIVQLPIFIGLYQALGSSVDLRRAAFLYIDNLAGPDRLFHHGFDLPFLGPDFNLLPIVTVVLYLINNKMFMPPPTTDEAAMQQKMMNVMMIVFGFLFYRLPAGLLVYFIISTLWGMGERKLMDILPAPKPKPPRDGDDDAPKRSGLMAKFGQWMDEAQQKVEAQKQEYERMQKQQRKNAPGRGGGRKKKRRH